METAFTIFFILAIAGVIAYLMTRRSGWHALVGKYPERAPYTGELRRCRTFQMAAVRFSGGIISVGFTKNAQDAPPLAVGRNERSAVEVVLGVQVLKAPPLAAG
ncbi:MAG: hypothetical protein HY527_15570 [Betaproteobacteria bacterium]|nr:hypothetical protein [Betaproteobacteria bacterium]